MVSNPPDLGNASMKSMEISSQIHFGMGKGSKRLVGNSAYAYSVDIPCTY